MKRILVVDDDSSMLLVCRRFFARCDPQLEMVEAASGEDAIAILQHQKFDVVLSDFRLGGADGTDVLMFTSMTQPDAVRVLMSGVADARAVEHARERAKIHEYIEKPMTMAELESKLREVLVKRGVNLVMAGGASSGQTMR
ncbi:MAG: response regulator [Candidatus Thermoplasmatota archaeon]